MTFPDGCVVETRLSQIPAGSLLAFNGDVLFRHYDDVTDVTCGRAVAVIVLPCWLQEALSG